MRFVGGCILISLEQSDLFRVLFERNSIEGQDARLNANRGLDLFFERKFVGIKLYWINLQFCYAHNRAADRFGVGRSLGRKQEGCQQQCSEQQQWSPAHMQPFLATRATLISRKTEFP